MFDHAELKVLQEIACELRLLRVIFTPRLSATLTYKGAHNMLNQIQIGQTLSPNYQEWSGLAGTGDKLTPAGPESYLSDTPTNIVVDPVTGNITGVAVGTATISSLDATDNVTASALVTCVEKAQSATLSYGS